MKFPKIRILFLAILICCFSLSGCATLGGATSGFAGAIGTLVALPFKVLGKVMGLVKHLPKPPPGVF